MGLTVGYGVTVEVSYSGRGFLGVQCRNLIKKSWAFIRVSSMNPTILGVIGPGFLNQVPTLGL